MSIIYRFMSSESFIDTILKKELCFIHPILWDDPYELEAFYKNKSLLSKMLAYKIYCQKCLHIKYIVNLGQKLAKVMQCGEYTLITTHLSDYL